MNIQEKFTWEEFIQGFNEKTGVARVLDYSLHREDVKEVLNKIKELNLKEHFGAVEYLFNSFLEYDKNFKLDPEIILSAWTIGKYSKFDFNVFLDNEDFLKNFFNSEQTIATDVEKFKNLNENVKAMSIMLDVFGFQSLDYQSTDLYQDDKFSEKVLELAERENWIDKNHKFIKGRYFTCLMTNKKMAKLADKSFKLKDCLYYSEQKCEDVVRNLYVNLCKSEMKEDLKKDKVFQKVRKTLKF